MKPEEKITNVYGLKSIMLEGSETIQKAGPAVIEGTGRHFEYYYRRGNKYFFRSAGLKVTMNLSASEVLKKVGLQYGKLYDIKAFNEDKQLL